MLTRFYCLKGRTGFLCLFISLLISTISLPSLAQDYSLSAQDSIEQVCPGDTANYTINIGSIGGYTDPVSLTLTGLPAGAISTFMTNPVTPAGSSILMIDTDTVSPGIFNLTVQASSTSGTKNLPIVLEILPPAPAVPGTTLLNPADGATNVTMPVQFDWSSAGTGYFYHIRIATDTTFSGTSIIDSITTTDTSYISTILNPNTTYYWYVQVIDTSIINGGYCIGPVWPASLNYRSFTTNNSCTGFSASAFVTSNYNGSDITCNGACDGELTAVVNGGTAPYTYNWNGFTGGQTTPVVTGICPGLYEVSVTDSNGCMATASVFIVDPIPLSATMSTIIPPSCAGCSDGELGAIGIGGTGVSYTYTWSNGATTATITGLAPGTYCCTITDWNGCQAVVCETLTPSCNITTSFTQVNVSCNSFCDGEATAFTSGGTAPYTYLWDANTANQNTATASGLCAGSYDVSVSDANGCSATASVVITEPTAITATMPTLLPPSCAGCSDGELGAIGTGGTAPYTYLWVTGATTATITGLAPGTYCCTITDFNGCQDVVCETITPTCNLSVSITNVNLSCNGFCDGEATASTSGGTPPYTYLWDAATANQNTATASGLCPGSYVVSVTDANGCLATSSAIITEPTVLSVLVDSITQPTCGSCLDGIIEVSGMGGTPPYTYNWSNTQTGNSISGLNPGNYTVTVTDANGCEDTMLVKLFDPTSIRKVEELEKVSIAPNPNRGHFTLTLQLKQPQNVQLTIHNVLGQVLWEKENLGANIEESIDAGHWAAGTYFITISTNNSRIVRKMVIKH